MTQELITPEQQGQSLAMTQRGMPSGANVGAVAIEQERAIAEAQGQLILAKKFPRDEIRAHDQLMKACSVKAFAETAFYSVPNRGSGPSIRFAEEVARVYGNFQYGHRELSRSEGKSEVEVYAWDMENNNHSKRQITVMHIVDTKYGPKPCRDQSDIDNLIANKASKQIRGRILALMPKWMVADAIERCKQTLAGTTDEPIEARVRRMTQAFSKFGVTVKMLEEQLGHAMGETTLDELVDLIGIFNAIKEGAKVAEYFSNREADESAADAATTKLAETAKAGATTRRNKPQPVNAQTAAAAQEKPAAEQDSKPDQKVSKQAEAEPEVVSEKAAQAEPTESETAQQEPKADPPAAEDDTELF